MKIALIGIGNVGSAIAGHLLNKGHQIVVGNNDRDSESVKKAIRQHLEHMTLLWVKMVRAGGNPNFVWSYLER